MAMDFLHPTLFLGGSLDQDKMDNYPIQKIIFTVRYGTKFGEDMAMSGSLLPLGNWNARYIMPLNIPI